MNITDDAIRLYRLLRDSKHHLTFEEARDRLGLSDEEMRQVVELLNEALEFDSHNEEARV